MNVLSAWRKGDLVRMSDGEEFRLTSEGYYCEQRQKVICDTDRGKPISYLELIETAWLVETVSGRKLDLMNKVGQDNPMDKEQQKQMLIGLLDWMNKVAQDNPMALETDSEDIVDMYLQGYYTK